MNKEDSIKCVFTTFAPSTRVYFSRLQIRGGIGLLRDLWNICQGNRHPIQDVWKPPLSDPSWMGLSVCRPTDGVAECSRSTRPGFSTLPSIYCTSPQACSRTGCTLAAPFPVPVFWVRQCAASTLLYLAASPWHCRLTHTIHHLKGNTLILFHLKWWWWWEHVKQSA